MKNGYLLLYFVKNSYDLFRHCINCRSSLIVKNECGYQYSSTFLCLVTSITRNMLFLLLAVLPITLLSQSSTIILAYMKVTPGHGSDYLKAEQAWKKVHQKAVELGVHYGWQLWSLCKKPVRWLVWNSGN